MSRLTNYDRTVYLNLFFGIMGLLLLLYATRSGIGLGVDSLHYIGA